MAIGERTSVTVANDFSSEIIFYVAPSTKVFETDSPFLNYYFSGITKRVLVVEAKKPTTITSVSAVLNGSTAIKFYIANDSNEEIVWSEDVQTNGKIIGSGLNTIVFTLTDSQGNSFQQTLTYNVIPYSIPNIIPYSGMSKIICERYNQSNVPDVSGTKIHLKFAARYSECEADGSSINGCTLSYKLKSVNSQTSWDNITWNDFDSAIASDSIISVDEVLDETVSSEIPYFILIRVIDTIGYASTATLNLQTEDVTFHLAEGGKAAAFGRMADTTEDNNLKIGSVTNPWKAYINDKCVRDFIISRGKETKEISYSLPNSAYLDKQLVWVYEKYASGKIEAWGSAELANIATQTTDLYYRLPSVFPTISETPVGSLLHLDGRVIAWFDNNYIAVGMLDAEHTDRIAESNYGFYGISRSDQSATVHCGLYSLNPDYYVCGDVDTRLHFVFLPIENSFS